MRKKKESENSNIIITIITITGRVPLQRWWKSSSFVNGEATQLYATGIH
jgi:hypothetical protein